MYKVGVIPAAGNGDRWGGYIKEMLPISDDLRLVDHTACAMLNDNADALVVVTNIGKYPILANHLVWLEERIYFTLQRGDRDMWSAMIEACEFPAERYLFAMPDTVYPPDAFIKAPDADFALGIFETDKPERFGVLHKGKVYNKSARTPGTFNAWGVLTWSANCVAFWREARPSDYTEAINLAIEAFGLRTWRLDYYHDMATFADYQEWIRENGA